jgi:hypothetical protein
MRYVTISSLGRWWMSASLNLENIADTDEFLDDVLQEADFMEGIRPLDISVDDEKSENVNALEQKVSYWYILFLCIFLVLSKHPREFLSNEICHHLVPGQVVDVYIKEEEQ